ncbi:MAG: hypothetical protein A3I38_02305 [Candidatus Wildermuthbacteria bacterium RIFCSPLOWO2_02_FULL_47_10]|uniref:Methyltransferase type 11 domain-containing protein n=1 Tax=Candidatus Wildermuthbacteria bacterium RIFCSPHIGHO2_02_FULL_47_17 TaxID=1802452 RepID=A0A1G2R882_9BACT|nr:MAG: hypothetical protein A3D59_01135 [Candidatus Wildermuthbacteria bacterium RIFCSPHIGHO2_02_FULL_47_17]OHA75695.1 MAG: hypothetical protein A3I38_02305 [Candidatus Wildermuthbacteria bacterium RIFCSPLOWO2_02_FULL_47_10]
MEKIKLNFLDYIRCPQCNSVNMKDGVKFYSCLDCKSRYPVVDKILILVRPKGQQAIKDLWNKKEKFSEFEFFTTKRVEKLVHQYTNSNSVTLDVGCGVGAYQKDFRGSTVSFDYVPYFLKKAAKKFGSSNRLFVIADATEFPFQSNKFDLVFCSQVIEHFTPKDSEIVLKNMVRATRNHIVLDTPNDGNPFIRTLRAIFYPGVADSDPSNKNRDTRMMHHKLMGRDDLEKYGFEAHSCIGYVSRHKFQIGSLWSIYDFIAWIFPDFGGNLIGVYAKK